MRSWGENKRETYTLMGKNNRLAVDEKAQERGKKKTGEGEKRKKEMCIRERKRVKG
jgi:hypothetical protein